MIIIDLHKWNNNLAPIQIGLVLFIYTEYLNLCYNKKGEIMNLTGTVKIETERLILRKLMACDSHSIYTLCTDKDILKYLAGIPEYTGIEMAENYIKFTIPKYENKDYFDWAICLKENNTMIGRISSFKFDEDKRMVDLAWQLIKEHRGKGYMTEAVKAIVEYFSKIGCERIEAFADKDNIASNKVIKKAGFEFEGILRKYDLNRDGKLYDANMYSIIKGE